jgi:hypothetical protein
VRHSLPLIAVLASTACVAACAGVDESATDVESSSAALCTPTQLKPTTAVASPSPKQAAKNAFDGNTGTRWESAYSDPQWIYFDLGAVKTITEVKIDWQHAAAKDYRIDVSNDAVNWSAPVITKTGGAAVDHRIDDLTGLSASGRYVRMYGTARATAYGYSIWEMYVYGYDAASCAANLLTAGWDGTSVSANFTPVAGYTFGASKNAISFDYTGKTFSVQSAPPVLTFTQPVTIAQAGTKWRLTLAISGMNDQTNYPPTFLALLGGVRASSYTPAGTVSSSSGGLLTVGQLKTGSQITVDFTLSLTAGQTLDVEIDDVPGLSSSGVGMQKFDLTGASLVRLQ